MNSADTVKCPKCEGHGCLNYHLNIENGRCFQCAGTGRVTKARASRRFAPTPVSVEHSRNELRNMWRAARSWRDIGWGECEDAPGLDNARQVAAYLVDLPASEHARVLAAFAAVTSPLAHSRIVSFLAERMAKGAA